MAPRAKPAPAPVQAGRLGQQHVVRRAHGEAAVAVNVPGEPEARRQVPPLDVQPGLSGREALVERAVVLAREAAGGGGETVGVSPDPEEPCR